MLTFFFEISGLFYFNNKKTVPLIRKNVLFSVANNLELPVTLKYLNVGINDQIIRRNNCFEY